MRLRSAGDLGGTWCGLAAARRQVVLDAFRDDPGLEVGFLWDRKSYPQFVGLMYGVKVDGGIEVRERLYRRDADEGRAILEALEKHFSDLAGEPRSETTKEMKNG